ncbi:uncharacterized protein LOC126835514 [Adelges cooleyi]|uniref:uncharacterized protein LOC126835514 n=1 Tax=Adelges cooleyi TaxID=133065 RepID=UPI00217F3E87|nr:uncharacterized protein LOC126835514 [Adelges cooleyi]
MKSISLHCVVLLAIYLFGLIISLVGTPPKEETTDAIENLKKNLVETDLIKYFVQGDVTSSSTFNMYPNYINAVNNAKALLLTNNFHGGRIALFNATKSMLVDKPELIKNQITKNQTQEKIIKVVDSFVEDVEKERYSTFTFNIK